MNLYSYAPNPVNWIDPWGLTHNEILYSGQFWKNNNSVFDKTKMRVKGAPVYKVKDKIDINGIKKGDYFHLDTFHKNEIEVYDSLKNHKAVYDLDGNKISGTKKGRICGEFRELHFR